MRPRHRWESLKSRLVEWRRTGDVTIAAELISEAAVVGYVDPLTDLAAEVVIDSDLSDFAKSVARGIHTHALPDSAQVVPPQLTFRQQIRDLKRLLTSDPRDAIRWADLALAYTSLGQIAQAREALRRSLILAPDNRLVLRNITRFWVHLRNPEAALFVLRRSPATPDDPWLLAAELSVSTLADERPQFTKAALRVMQGGRFHDRHLSELAGAMASLELRSGNARRARKFFRRALTSPTENAVAQAAWAHFAGGLDIISEEHLSPTANYEARARESAYSGDWNHSVLEASSWVADQPFSVGAAAFASYVAAVGALDYAAGAQFATRGLQANPQNTLLLNNLAFCRASMGNPSGAAEVISQIPRAEVQDDGVLLATTGLIEFRRGNPTGGRLLYRKAINLFKTKNLPKSEALAAIFLAREERIAVTEEATQALEGAIRLSAGRPEPEIRRLLASLLVPMS
jgi:Flp pilus assembly protein TadD